MELIQPIIKSDKELKALLKTNPSAIDVLCACGAHYEVIIDPAAGAPITPLVRYTPKTLPASGPSSFIGNAYERFALVTSRPAALRYLAECLASQFQARATKVDRIVTVPRGGLELGTILAEHLGLKPEQVLHACRDGTNLKQMHFRKVKTVLIVDDVYHRFSAARQILKRIKTLEISQITIACVINRALKPTVNGYEIASLYHHSTWQHDPDDPLVQRYVRTGNVVDDPIEHWDELLEKMYSAQPTQKLVVQF